MSNYKYAIKKLPIKSWIKYWLWRNRTGGTKYKFALSDIKEGTNFYLENTIKRKFNMFELFGKTTQNGTPTPENPIPIVNITGNINEKVQNTNLEQNISFPLEEGQVFAEGDYLADDGIHNVRGKVVLDGTENWNYNSSNNVFIISNFINYKIGAYTPMSTHYVGQMNVTEYRDVNDKSISCLNSSINNRLIIKDTRYTSANDFKAFLVEQYNNGTPVEIEYELAEEYVEPFTEEQAEAYNKIKELYTYNEITNIDGNANLKIKYWERVER